jgi:hypothetical protein
VQGLDPSRYKQMSAASAIYRIQTRFALCQIFIHQQHTYVILTYSENNTRIRCNGSLEYLISSVTDPAKILHHDMWRLDVNAAYFRFKTRTSLAKKNNSYIFLPHVLNLCKECRRIQRAIWSVPESLVHSLSCRQPRIVHGVWAGGYPQPFHSVIS